MEMLQREVLARKVMSAQLELPDTNFYDLEMTRLGTLVDTMLTTFAGNLFELQMQLEMICEENRMFFMPMPNDRVAPVKEAQEGWRSCEVGNKQFAVEITPNTIKLLQLRSNSVTGESAWWPTNPLAGV